MRIAIQKDIRLEDGDAAATLEEAARTAGFECVDITTFNGSIDLVDTLAPANYPVLDLLITPYELPGLQALHVISEARERLPLLYTIVVDDTPTHAAAAAVNSIGGYIVSPVTRCELWRVATRELASLARLYRASFTFADCRGEHRIPFHSIVYCETSGHNQVLHMEDGSTLCGRYSSQALFDLLSADCRFFKVGSSYIVNLNEVLEVNTPLGQITLSNGNKLSVPFRMRKEFEKTVLAWT